MTRLSSALPPPPSPPTPRPAPRAVQEWTILDDPLSEMCDAAGPGHSDSFPHCLLIVHQCTRTHLPHPESPSVQGVRGGRDSLSFSRLFAHSAPVYPDTLDACSSLA
jgi:hypothetical protein